MSADRWTRPLDPPRRSRHVDALAAAPDATGGAESPGAARRRRGSAARGLRARAPARHGGAASRRRARATSAPGAWRASDPGARAACASGAPVAFAKALERLGDSRDLTLGHLREERQRQRARRDVLARPGTPPRGGRTARGRSSSGGSRAGRACAATPRSRRARDDGVAVDARAGPGRRTRTSRGGRRRASAHGSSRPSMPPAPRGSSAGHARAAGEQLVEALELGEPERARRCRDRR